MDPNNPVVRLCTEGMKAEADGRPADALQLFLRGWEKRQDDLDTCIAAHYIARHQQTPEEILRWNQESLNRADAVNDERVQAFYPSLYLNLGKAYEDLGNREEAKRHYELAAARMKNLPDGRYGDIVRDGVQQGLQRVS